jgi:hypothetical protein
LPSQNGCGKAVALPQFPLAPFVEAWSFPAFKQSPTPWKPREEANKTCSKSLLHFPLKVTEQNLKKDLSTSEFPKKVRQFYTSFLLIPLRTIERAYHI